MTLNQFVFIDKSNLPGSSYLGVSNVITFWPRDIENAYVIMDFLFQIFCDNKTQQILQETNALKVVDQLAGFFYLYKKQAN